MNDQENQYGAEFVRTVPRKVKVVLVHDDRLICDSDVYINGELAMNLKVDFEEINSGLVVDDINVLIGTNKYGGMCHFKWQGPK